MGKNKIHKLSKPKRLFASGANHKHDYSQVGYAKVVSPIGERFYEAVKCSKCDAMLVGQFVLIPDKSLPVTTLRTNHKWRIELGSDNLCIF